MGQNRLKMGFSNLSVPKKGLLIQDWLFRLGRVVVDPYLVQKKNEGSDKSCLITYDAYQVLNLSRLAGKKPNMFFTFILLATQ